METQVFPQVTGFSVIGHGDMITSRVEIGEWYVVPLDQWDSTIPIEAVQAMERILKSGISIKGFVVAEDIREYQLRQKAKPEPPKVDSEQIKEILAVVFTVIGVIGLVLVEVILAALSADPVLICVTQENEWLELYAW